MNGRDDALTTWLDVRVTENGRCYQQTTAPIRGPHREDVVTLAGALEYVMPLAGRMPLAPMQELQVAITLRRVR